MMQSGNYSEENLAGSYDCVDVFIHLSYRFSTHTINNIDRNVQLIRIITESPEIKVYYHFRP